MGYTFIHSEKRETSDEGKTVYFPPIDGCTMSCIMSQLNTGKIVFPAIVAMMVLQSMVASIASFVFPAGLVGAKLTHRLYKGKSYVVFLLISSILPAIYFTAIMSISGLLRMMGYHENFWKIYVSSFPRNVMFGYVSSIFWNVILDKLFSKKEA